MWGSSESTDVVCRYAWPRRLDASRYKADPYRRGAAPLHPVRHNFRTSPEPILDRNEKFAENYPRRTKSEVSPSLAPRSDYPWLPLLSLPCALKLKPICAAGLPHPLPIAIATHLNWCPPAFRKWMHCWGDCRAVR